MIRALLRSARRRWLLVLALTLALPTAAFVLRESGPQVTASGNAGDPSSTGRAEFLKTQLGEIRQRLLTLPPQPSVPPESMDQEQRLNAIRQLQARILDEEHRLAGISSTVERLDRDLTNLAESAPLTTPDETDRTQHQQRLAAAIAALRSGQRTLEESGGILKRLRSEHERLREDYRLASTQGPSDEFNEARRIAWDRSELERSARRLEDERAALLAGDTPGILPTSTLSLPSLLLLYGAIGLACGLTAATLAEQLQKGLRSEYDIHRYINLPLLGSVPHIARPSERLLTGAEPDGSLAETFHSAAVLLQRIAATRSERAFLVTSTEEGEGKTTCIVNLSLALARSGRNVLLIDADLRKPMIREIFGLDSGADLGDWMEGKDGLEAESLLRAGGIDHLTLLPTRVLRTPILPLLQSTRFEDLLQTLRPRFDFILIDAPPVFGAADTLQLSEKAEGIILVASSRGADKEEVSRAKRLLKQAGGKPVASILNNVAIRSFGYYYYREERAVEPVGIGGSQEGGA